MLKHKQIQGVAKYISFGTELTGSMIIPVLIGWYVDSKWETEPWGIIVGGFFGFLSLIWKLYRIALEANKK